MAGIITYIAYSFTIGVDENFAQQSVSTNYTVSTPPPSPLPPPFPRM